MRVLCLALALAAAASLAVPLFLWMKPEPPRYELEAAGREIDFTAPEIKTHTAADGVAVVKAAAMKPAPALESMASGIDPAPAAEPARFTADPAAIWQQAADAGSAPTHGGFKLPVPMDGESIGVLTVPDIGLTVRVYESDDEMAAMTKGVAHFKSTSAWDGNVALSGHNINFDGSAGYFLNLYTLKKGAVIQYETAHGKREYAVESVTEIAETDWGRLGRTEDNRVTLITCISGKPSLRLCVQAVEIKP
jgi:LPXTG-site transpeptidase (sortase) family protein